MNKKINYLKDNFWANEHLWKLIIIVVIALIFLAGTWFGYTMGR